MVFVLKLEMGVRNWLIFLRMVIWLGLRWRILSFFMKCELVNCFYFGLMFLNSLCYVVWFFLLYNLYGWWIKSFLLFWVVLMKGVFVVVRFVFVMVILLFLNFGDVLMFVLFFYFFLIWFLILYELFCFLKVVRGFFFM